MNTLRITAASIAVLLITLTSADARRHRGGGLICGAVQMSHYGIHDQRFRLAKHWAAALPHTNAHPGAVVVQSRRGRDSAGNPGGHVSRIVSMRGNCSALVADSRGTYVRDICKNLIAYVDPNGNRVAAVEKSTRKKIRVAHRSHRRHYARMEIRQEFVPPDRYMIH